MHRVCIPQSTSARAADALITALGGPEMAFKVAGGTKWWQVRAGRGVECEWLAMKKHYTEKKDRIPDDGDCGCELTSSNRADNSRARDGPPAVHAVW